jgi:hypothetical protein
MTCSREAYVKDIEVLLEGQRAAKVPLLISSAAATAPTCMSTCSATSSPRSPGGRGWRFKLAKIYSDVDKAHIARELKAGRSSRSGRCRRSTRARSMPATVVVAQIGAEPFVKALDEK